MVLWPIQQWVLQEQTSVNHSLVQRLRVELVEFKELMEDVQVVIVE